MEGKMGMIRKARIARTKMLMQNREVFLNLLRKEINAVLRKAKRMNLIPCIRLNGTSDIPFLAVMLCREFPKVQFYDYTKIPIDNTRLSIPNYHLTFSRSEENDKDVLVSLSKGVSVAVVFDTLKGQDLPKTYLGYKVIDGDISDLRFLDEKGVIVGLRSKGRKHRKNQVGNPFIVSVTPLVQTPLAA